MLVDKRICCGVLTVDAMGWLIEGGWGQRALVGSGSETGHKQCETHDVPRFGALCGR